MYFYQFRTIFAFFCCIAFSACIKAPLELQTAVKRQHQEITQIKTFYGDSMNNLFDEIEALQLHYVDEFEKGMIDKYKFKRGENPGTRATDDDLNVVLVSVEERIHSFADQRRTDIKKNISEMKKQYLAVNQSIDNADAINQDIGTYVDSLIKYRKSQDALGQALLQKVNALTPAALPSSIAFGSLLKTFESDFVNAVQNPQPKLVTQTEK